MNAPSVPIKEIIALFIPYSLLTDKNIVNRVKMAIPKNEYPYKNISDQARSKPHSESEEFIQCGAKKSDNI